MENMEKFEKVSPEHDETSLLPPVDQAMLTVRRKSLFRVCFFFAMLQSLIFTSIAVGFTFLHASREPIVASSVDFTNIDIHKITNTSPSEQSNRTSLSNIQPLNHVNTTIASALLNERHRISKHIKRQQALQIYMAKIPLHVYTFDSKMNSTTAELWGEKLPPKRTCALVGNSGILTGSQCGEAIDAHDYVIRANLAPIGGKFRGDAGSKVDLVTVNLYQFERLREIMRNERLLRQEKYNLIFKRFKMYAHSVVWILKGVQQRRIKDFQLLVKWLRRKKLNVRWGYPSTSLMRRNEKIWRIKAPTSGMIMLSTAILFCDHITLYGFYPFGTSPSDDHAHIPQHYYEPDSVSANVTIIHQPQQEFGLLRGLESRGVLRLMTEACTS